MIEKRPVGIFDSGVGGLTVLKEIEKILPSEDLIYFGDSLRAPYGSRDSKEVAEFCLRIGKFLEEIGSKLLVIACNTATIAALKELQEKLSIPVIGVINPGAREALKVTKNNKVGVLLTPLTAKLNAYRDEIKKINESVEVHQVGCKPIVQMIESGWEDTPENCAIIKYYVDKLPKDADVVVFGCTHFPIIKEHFMKELKGKVIVDPAKETALEVKKILKELDLLNKGEKNGKVYFYTSGSIIKFKKLAEKILGRPIETIKQALN
jgi:glutamate racemase